MTTDRDRLSETEIDRLLDDLAATDVGQPSDALMRRVMEDARSEMVSAPVSSPSSAPKGSGLIAKFLKLFGGLPGAAGLAVAGVAGVMIGYTDTGILADATSVFGLQAVQYDIGDLYPTYAFEGDL